MNLIKGEVATVDAGRARIRLAGTAAAITAPAGGMQQGDAVTLGIRPERMAGQAADAIPITGRVAAAEHLGEATFLYLRLADGLVRAAGEPDDDYSAQLTSGAIHVFDKGGEAVAG